MNVNLLLQSSPASLARIILTFETQTCSTKLNACYSFSETKFCIKILRYIARHDSLVIIMLFGVGRDIWCPSRIAWYWYPISAVIIMLMRQSMVYEAPATARRPHQPTLRQTNLGKRPLRASLSCTTGKITRETRKQLLIVTSETVKSDYKHSS